MKSWGIILILCTKNNEVHRCFEQSLCNDKKKLVTENFVSPEEFFKIDQFYMKNMAHLLLSLEKYKLLPISNLNEFQNCVSTYKYAHLNQDKPSISLIISQVHHMDSFTLYKAYKCYLFYHVKIKKLNETWNKTT